MTKAQPNKRSKISHSIRFAAVGLFGAYLITAGAPARARVVEKIAAVVNNEIVLASEVEERATPFMRQIAGITNQAERQARAEALRKEVLDRLIDDVLIEQQAREFKQTVSSEEIDRSIEGIKNDHSLTDEQLRAAVSSQGMTMASYRRDVKRQILRFRVLQIAVMSKVSLTEAELRAYYNRHIRQGTDAEVRASHIFIAIPEDADAGTVDERRKIADELLERALAGGDFAELARQHSEDPATRADGGDLGFFGRDLLPKAIEDAVFSMEIGELRGPVRVGHGFHVIKLTDKKVKAAKPFEEMEQEIRMKLRARAAEKHTKAYLAELRSHALIDIRL